LLKTKRNDIFYKKHLTTLIGILIGTIAGYLYRHQAGCLSGTCPITSRPVKSSLYGALMGGLLFSIFKNRKTKTK